MIDLPILLLIISTVYILSEVFKTYMSFRALTIKRKKMRMEMRMEWIRNTVRVSRIPKMPE